MNLFFVRVRYLVIWFAMVVLLIVVIYVILLIRVCMQRR